MSRDALSRFVFTLFCFIAIAASLSANIFAQAAGPVADPKLDAVLEKWHQDSQNIKKLEGSHVRIVYDFVFGVAERAEGRFYYEAPDKGRIDLEPDKSGAGNRFSKKHPETGEAVEMTAKPDRPEQWICDGAQVLVIDEEHKTAEQFPIPPQARGANIMDGPLPFLFGMSPEKAKARYQMRLLGANGNEIDLLVIPKLPKDSANYKWARVRIEKATMLPMAVQMLDPPGTRETVYTFPRIAKNPTENIFKGLIWWKEANPFKPDLRKYKIQAAQVQAIAEQKPAAPAGPQQLVPAVVGFDFKQAQQLLQRAGYEVKLLRGQPAERQELIYRVQKQSPAPKAVAKPGEVIALTLYTPPIEQTGAQKVAGLPDVLGMDWKAAEKLLTEAGYEVKFRQGRVAANAQEVFQVYDQQPKAGVAANQGSPIILTLFIRPDMVKK